MIPNYYGYLIYFVLFQFIPAVIIDVSCSLSGRKTWAIKLQKRIFDSLKVFEYFLINQWEWDNKNCQLLSQRMNVEERNDFNFDVSSLDYNQYIENWVIGSRRFMMKLDDANIPEGRRKFVILYWLDFIVKSLFFVGFSYFGVRMYSRMTRPVIEVS